MHIDSTVNIYALVQAATQERGAEDVFDEVEDSEDHEDYYGSGCHSSFHAIVPKAGCLAGDLSSQTLVALIGDSKAAQWFYALDMVARERASRLLSYTKKGCPAIPIPLHYPHSSDGMYRACDEWRRLALARVAADRPRAAVLAFSHSYTRDARRGIADADWQDGLRAAVAQLRAAGVRPLLLLDTPEPGLLVNECILHSEGDHARCALLHSGALNQPVRAALAAAARELGVAAVDPAPWFCGSASGEAAGGGWDSLLEEGAELCPVVVGGVPVYRDALHVTTRYTRLLARALADALPPW
jgi:hypothetical protein